jgi:c-di-AMP phosphodiesterase-like protein
VEEKNRLFKKENYLVILILPLLISLGLIIYNLVLGALAFILCLGLYFYLNSLNKKADNYLQNYLDDLDYSFDAITKNVVFSMPFPVVILEEDKKIKWHNTNFKTIFDKDILVGRKITDLITKFQDIELDEDTHQPISIDIGEENYEFYFSKIESSEGEILYFFYGVNNTADEYVRKLFKDKSVVAFSLYVDNYEDVKNSTEVAKRTEVLGEIDRIILQYFQSLNAIVRRYENDKYIVIMERRDYEKIYEKKFPILDSVRKVDKGNNIRPTLSIGVGFAGENLFEIYEDSRMAIDIALSRGGDQAVIKLEDNYEFFGGKSRATEKTSKVRSRVISHALRRLIESSNDIYVMGHNNPDMDSFGSALGIYDGVKSIGRDSYFILNGVNKSIENIYNRTVELLPEFKDHVLTEEEALERITPSSLIIVTDNHRKNSTEAPKLLDKTDQIVIIDHHRRGKDYIKNATISYIEPYASSASELVTEMLNYFDEDFKARSPVAEALLAGITVDTKNFVYQTGVRTFEAASILKRWGADSIIIKRMFKDDFEIVRYKSEVISEAIIFDNDVAIGHFNRDIDGSTLIASQAADDLLNIKGVKASFVLTYSNEKIHISGRSLGDISVQLILERIGGGGHLTSAATQLDMSMEDAENMLKKAIKEYIMEEIENESNID